MIKDAKEYFTVLRGLFGSAIATNRNCGILPFNKAIEVAVKMINQQALLKKKILLIGNGASASIASHIATDFWKNSGVRASAFNDSSSLTCISNDYGYKYVFEKPIEAFTDSGDILFAISSSGRSENILQGVSAARKRKAKVISLSGFDKDNPLRKLGDINFYIPSSSYGHVEILHHSICHCLVDITMKLKSG